MHALMTCVKDEGPFILEFVAHHLVLGFDRILMASNDCSDGSDDLLAALHRAGYVQHLHHNVTPREVPQHAGYAKLRAAFGLDGVQWLMVLDVDEFLHVSVGNGRVQALTAAAPPEVDIIALNALTYGTDLGANWQAGRVCAQFTHRFGKAQGRNGAIKSLTRAPLRFRSTHNHHMEGYCMDGPLRVMRGDGSLFEVDTLLPIWKSLRVIKPTKTCQNWAHYNHYAVKTYDSFALRRARGRGAQAAKSSAPMRHTDDYFAAHIGASVFDDSISVYATLVQGQMEKMLADPAIAAAQASCEARYGAMVADLRAQQIEG
ncbi:MAG: glycosyltransferase family 2 protein [Cypionkella sp.]|nr:glycosyltransferase family 2 protein [Cypionkella sp.]